MRETDLTERLGEMKRPTVVPAGTNDGMVPVAQSSSLQREVRRA